MSKDDARLGRIVQSLPLKYKNISIHLCSRKCNSIAMLSLGYNARAVNAIAKSNASYQSSSPATSSSNIPTTGSAIIFELRKPAICLVRV